MSELDNPAGRLHDCLSALGRAEPNQSLAEAWGCFSIYNQDGSWAGDTTVYPYTPGQHCKDNPQNFGDTFISFTGQGCMVSPMLQSSDIGFELKETGQSQFDGLQGYINKSVVPDATKFVGMNTGGSAPSRTACSKRISKGHFLAAGTCTEAHTRCRTPQSPANPEYRQTSPARCSPATRSTPTETEPWTSSATATRTIDHGDPLSRNQGLSGLLDGSPDANGATNPNEGFIFTASSDVQGGDVVRAMLPKTTPFTELDYMTYSDPNDYNGNANDPDQQTTQTGQNIVGTCRIARWAFGYASVSGTRIFGWIPRSVPQPAGCA